MALPSETSSKSKRIFDADSIIIEKTIRFEENIYSKGVIKICDFAQVIITSDGNTDYLTSEGLTPLCKVFWRLRVLSECKQRFSF